MSNNKDKSLILNKIKSHYDFKSNADLARFLDISPGVVSNWYTRNSIDYDLVFTKCVGIDKNYLINDDAEPALELNEPTERYILRSDSKLSKQAIPLYDISASAGLQQVFNGSPNIIDYVSIPNLPRCDGALFVTGDSMYPLLKAGDIVAYKVINNLQDDLLWGEMYVLSFLHAGDYLTVTKFVQPSEMGVDYVKLVSHNSHHAPKDIPMKNINAIAMIKASIRFNSMN